MCPYSSAGIAYYPGRRLLTRGSDVQWGRGPMGDSNLPRSGPKSALETNKQKMSFKNNVNANKFSVGPEPKGWKKETQWAGSVCDSWHGKQTLSQHKD